MAGFTETMSATPNNSGTAFGLAPAPANTVSPTPTLEPQTDSSRDSGRNALQALLAFACIHEQAKRRRLKSGEPASARFNQEEEFALDEVLQLVADRAFSITGADGVAIALAEDNAIVCRASTGRIAPDRGARIDPNSGFSGTCLRSGQTVRCDDSETDSRVNGQACRALGTRSMVAVPLSAKQRVIGLVEAFSSDSYGFNDADVRSLNLLAELILAAIRPAEEDRLAELSKRIVVPAAAPPSESETAAVASHTPSRILLDEFLPPPAPSPKKGGDVKTEPSPAAAKLPAGEPTPPAVEPSLVAAESAISPEPVSLKSADERQPITRILSTVAAILVAGFLLWALIWKVKHVEQVSSANTQTPPVTVKESDGEAVKVLATEPLEVKSGANPEVTGIRHWSVSDTSTVVVDLEDQVEYEAHALDNPARMYFDLHDTRLAPGLANQSLDLNDDPFLKRIRMAQPVDGITRVVLETKREAEFSFSLERNPYRLTIEVHKPGVAAVPQNSPAPLAKRSPGVSPRKALTRTSPSGLRIVLDAGHGGWDLGTVGRKGLLEKDLVLDITQRVGTLLQEKLGAQVTYTRTDDSYLSLEKRAEIANLAKADLFVSVHANYSDLATAHGVETYYTNTYSSVKARTDAGDPALQQVDWTGVDIRAKVTDSHRLATDIQQALYGGLARRNPDIRNRGVKEAQYVVLTGTQMPAVLAEVSFVSSPADEDKLESSEYRQQIAEALYRGVARYRQELQHTKLASAKNLN